MMVELLIEQYSHERASTMNVYHYTKGYNLQGILKDGFIAKEGTRGRILVKPITSFVWLTSSNVYPRTALPGVPALPYTLLLNHLGSVKPCINWKELSEIIGGIYRISFDGNDPRIKKWKFSNERKSLLSDDRIKMLEAIARKAGDDVDSFYISNSELELADCKVQRFENGIWIDVLQFNFSGEAVNDSSFTVEKMVQACSNNKVA
jgi:hypothetical protein